MMFFLREALEILNRQKGIKRKKCHTFGGSKKGKCPDNLRTFQASDKLKKVVKNLPKDL